MCTNGNLVADGGGGEDATLIGKSDGSGNGNYIFVMMDDEMQTMGMERSYAKVADTSSEMDQWIEENDPLL